MCRNTRTLKNLTEPALDEEISYAVLQLVRKMSGYVVHSVANEHIFNRDVNRFAVTSRTPQIPSAVGIHIRGTR